MATLLCYGDSNTHGTKPLTALGQFDRHALQDRWPEVLAAGLGAGHTVLSEGLPGRTTVHEDLVEGGMRNGLTVLPALLHSHIPLDAMILMLGTNDLKHRFGVTSFEIARSIERLITCTRNEIGLERILVMAPPPVSPRGVLSDPFAGASATQSGLTAHIAAAAERQTCAFFDAGSVVTVSDVDGVHWDAAQHHALGAALVPVVRELLS